MISINVVVSRVVVFIVVVLFFLVMGFVGSLGGDLLLNFLIFSCRLGPACC